MLKIVSHNHLKQDIGQIVLKMVAAVTKGGGKVTHCVTARVQGDVSGGVSTRGHI